jgi:hypothetical protein
VVGTEVITELVRTIKPVVPLTTAVIHWTWKMRRSVLSDVATEFTSSCDSGSTARMTACEASGGVVGFGADLGDNAASCDAGRVG